MTDVEYSIQEDYARLLFRLEDLWNKVKNNHCENEQWVLDILDKLNQYSVRN